MIAARAHVLGVPLVSCKLAPRTVRLLKVVPPARGRANSRHLLKDGVGSLIESWENLSCCVKPETMREASVPPASFRNGLRGG